MDYKAIIQNIVGATIFIALLASCYTAAALIVIEIPSISLLVSALIIGSVFVATVWNTISAIVHAVRSWGASK